MIIITVHNIMIQLLADVMGPTVENMHKLLRLPTGCGEQNMAKLATNVHVLSYLTNTGQLNKKRETRAKTYIAQGGLILDFVKVTQQAA